MPLATVTGGPTAPAGRNIAAGTRLAVRYDEPYADGANVYPQTHNAEWDVSTNSWKPLGAANGTTFQIPVGADGYPRPPGSWLTELLVLDDGSEQTSRRGPIRIYETTAGEWFYGSPAPGAIFVSNPDVPGATAVLQTEVGVANGVAALDGAGGATFTGQVNEDGADIKIDARAIAEYGSNSNGAFVRFYSGLQVCFATLTYTYASGFGGRLLPPGNQWNYPAAFVASPVAFLAGMWFTYTGAVDRNNAHVNVYRSTSVALEYSGIYANSDVTGFVSGDTMDVMSLTVGRWF